MIVIAIILVSIILLSITGAIVATRCPECKKWFAHRWQDVHQRDICKHCAWLVYAKDFEPPKASWLKWMQVYSPLKQFNIAKDIKDRRKK